MNLLLPAELPPLLAVLLAAQLRKSKTGAPLTGRSGLKPGLPIYTRPTRRDERGFAPRTWYPSHTQVTNYQRVAAPRISPRAGKLATRPATHNGRSAETAHSFQTCSTSIPCSLHSHPFMCVAPYGTACAHLSSVPPDGCLGRCVHPPLTIHLAAVCAIRASYFFPFLTSEQPRYRPSDKGMPANFRRKALEPARRADISTPALP